MPFNTTTRRLVKESCGHEKCRVCLLGADNGCQQCPPEEYLEEAEHMQQPEEEGANVNRVELINCSPMDYWEQSHPNEEESVIQEEVEEPEDEEVVPEETPEEEAGPMNHVIYEDMEPGFIYSTPQTVFVVDQQQHVEEADDQHPPAEEELLKFEPRKKNRPATKNPMVKKELPEAPPQKITYSDDNLPQHLEKVNNEGVVEYYECTFCDKKLRPNLLSYHIYCDPSIPRPFQCDICAKGFRTNDHFRYHMTTHATGSSFSCNSCEKTFRNKITLNSHVRQFHSGLKPSHTCPTCNKPFFSLAKYKIHIAVHTDELPYVCPHCTSRFRLKENLTKHITVTHSDARPFYCSVCSVGFKRNGAYKQHMRRIHPDGGSAEVVGFCKQCGKGFSHYTLLRRHEKSHQTNGVEYRCRICTVVCSRKDNLVRHVRVMHLNADASIEVNDRDHYTTVDWAAKPAAEAVDSDEADNKDVFKQEQGDVEGVEGMVEEEVVIDDDHQLGVQLMEGESDENPQSRQSSVIIYVGAPGNENKNKKTAEAKERTPHQAKRGNPPPLASPVKRNRRLGDEEDFENMSSDRMEIYRKILMPSRDVYSSSLDDEEAEKEQQEEGYRQRKRGGKRNEGAFVL